jgi:molecular chaperone GrpE (heat shock protein)
LKILTIPVETFRKLVSSEIKRVSQASEGTKSAEAQAFGHEPVADSMTRTPDAGSPPPLVSAIAAALSSEDSFAELGPWLSDPGRAGPLHRQLIELADRIKPAGPTNGHPAKVEDSIDPVAGEHRALPAREAMLPVHPIKHGLNDHFSGDSQPGPSEALTPSPSDPPKVGRFRSLARAVKGLPSLVVRPLRSIRGAKGGREREIRSGDLNAALALVHEELLAIRTAIAEPVEAKASVIADRVVDRLAEGAPALFKQVAEEYFRLQNEDLIKVLKELPLLFDAIEVPLETWRVETKLSDEERLVRKQVLPVLEAIKRKLNDWKLRQNIEDIASGPDETPPYDAYWHRCVGVKTDDDTNLIGKVARTVNRGYQWNGERLRKAEVIVYEAPAEDENTSTTPTTQANR